MRAESGPLTPSIATGSSASADYDIIIVGAGAAGIAAGRRLATSELKFRILEARARIGGRAWTVKREYPLDLGCGWLHSADVNPLTSLLKDIGFTIDRTLPAWGRHSLDLGFSKKEQAQFRKAMASVSTRGSTRRR